MESRNLCIRHFHLPAVGVVATRTRRSRIRLASHMLVKRRSATCYMRNYRFRAKRISESSATRRDIDDYVDSSRIVRVLLRVVIDSWKIEVYRSANRIAACGYYYWWIIRLGIEYCRWLKFV